MIANTTQSLWKDLQTKVMTLPELPIMENGQNLDLHFLSHFSWTEINDNNNIDNDRCQVVEFVLRFKLTVYFRSSGCIMGMFTL